MITTRYNLDGVNRVRNSARAFVSFNRNKLDPEVYAWTQGVRRTLKGKRYPAYGGKNPPPSWRTGRLGSSWAVVKIKDSHYAVVNTATNRGFNYPVFAVMRDSQKWRWWWTLQDVVEGELSGFRNMVYRRMGDLAV